jgi:hypothetical protein
MSTIIVKENIMAIVVDDLNYGLEMLHLKQKCSIGMAPSITLLSKV